MSMVCFNIGLTLDVDISLANLQMETIRHAAYVNVHIEEIEKALQMHHINAPVMSQHLISNEGIPLYRWGLYVTAAGIICVGSYLFIS